MRTNSIHTGTVPIPTNRRSNRRLSDTLRRCTPADEEVFQEDIDHESALSFTHTRKHHRNRRNVSKQSSAAYEALQYVLSSNGTEGDDALLEPAPRISIPPLMRKNKDQIPIPTQKQSKSNDRSVVQQQQPLEEIEDGGSCTSSDDDSYSGCSSCSSGSSSSASSSSFSHCSDPNCTECGYQYVAVEVNQMPNEHTDNVAKDDDDVIVTQVVKQVRMIQPVSSSTSTAAPTRIPASSPSLVNERRSLLPPSIPHRSVLREQNLKQLSLRKANETENANRPSYSERDSITPLSAQLKKTVRRAQRYQAQQEGGGGGMLEDMDDEAELVRQTRSDKPINRLKLTYAARSNQAGTSARDEAENKAQTQSSPVELMRDEEEMMPEDLTDARQWREGWIEQTLGEATGADGNHPPDVNNGGTSTTRSMMNEVDDSQQYHMQVPYQRRRLVRRPTETSVQAESEMDHLPVNQQSGYSYQPVSQQVRFSSNPYVSHACKKLPPNTMNSDFTTAASMAAARGMQPPRLYPLPPFSTHHPYQYAPIPNAQDFVALPGSMYMQPQLQPLPFYQPMPNPFVQQMSPIMHDTPMFQPIYPPQQSHHFFQRRPTINRPSTFPSQVSLDFQSNVNSTTARVPLMRQPLNQSVRVTPNPAVSIIHESDGSVIIDVEDDSDED